MIRPGLRLGLAAVALACGLAQANERAVPASISPEAQAYLRSLPGRPPGGGATDDPTARERIRRGLGGMFLANARKIRTDYTLERVDAGGAESFWVRTPDKVRRGRALLYIHGGGFILGSPQTDLALPLRIGPAADMAVLSVNYRLAPEHTYPAALDDVVAAYRWLLDQGYRARHIGVFGDSAGGQLALALTLRAREQRLPLPAAVVLLSPVADLTGAGDTRLTLDTADPILARGSAERWNAYLGGHDPRDPLVSPVFADYRGLPPLLIQVGTREVLLSDSVRVARAARAAGVDVTLDVWEGMWHVWQVNPDVPEAKQAAAEVAAFFRRHVGGRR